jgi:bifunctional non-homologous end joining protein LigD
MDEVVPMPTFPPMLASTGSLPRGDLSWELKWDGFRTQALVDGCAGRLRVLTRSGRRIDDSVPELGGLLDAVGCRRMVLDGELVAGDGGPDSFYRLGGRLAASTPRSIARSRARVPLTLVVFDVLWLDGEALVTRPYRERRQLLEGLDLMGAYWMTTPVYADGEALLAACEIIGAEGAIAKRADSIYVSRRSSAWVKRKSARWLSEHALRRRPGGSGHRHGQAP